MALKFEKTRAWVEQQKNDASRVKISFLSSRKLTDGTYKNDENFVVFGKLRQNLFGQVFHGVYNVSGKISTYAYENETGEKIYSTQCLLYGIEPVDKKTTAADKAVVAEETAPF